MKVFFESPVSFLYTGLLFLFFSPWSSPAFGQEPEITSRLNRTIVPVDQQFQIEVELQGPNGAPEPEIPDIAGFASYIGSGSSTSMQIVNGRMSVSKVFTYHFIATKEGQFQIPPFKINYNGKIYSSEPLDLQIVKAQTTTPAPRGDQNSGDSGDISDKLFLRAEVNKRRVFQNEPVVVTYKIYTLLNVTNYGISQLPNTVGFWAEEFELPQRVRLYDEIVNGQTYRVAEIKKMALFPQGPGEKTLSPMVIEVEVQLPRGRRRRDIFDSFFDDPFFSRNVRRQLNSNSVPIEVLPLPERGKPDDFSGAVGNFSVTANVDRRAVKTNEAVTLKVLISGRGNMKILPRPEIDFPADFEVYEPKVNETMDRKGSEINGFKAYEFVMIPRFQGNYTIKPVTLSYFDPGTGNYNTVATSAIDISVSKGQDQFVSTGSAGSKEDVKFIGQDIRFIQLRIPEFRTGDREFYKSILFHMLLVVPLLALAGAVWHRRHLEKLSSNVAYARSRKANQMALKRLKAAGKKMQEGNPRDFYSEVSKALMGFIGDKFNISPAGLITDQVSAVLHDHGTDPEAISEYVDILQRCDFQRFAPSQSDNGEMKSFFEKARGAIVRLDRSL